MKRSLLAGFGLLLILTACGDEKGPALQAPNMHAASEGAAGIHRGQTVTIGSMFACLDKDGSVTVTNLAPIKPIGLEVTGFAVRPNPFWKASQSPIGGQIGVARRSLAQLKFPTSRVVDAKCGKKGEGYEFAAQVEKTTTGEAGAAGWVATYTTQGKTRRFYFPLTVRLCNEKSASAEACRALKW